MTEPAFLEVLIPDGTVEVVALGTTQVVEVLLQGPQGAAGAGSGTPSGPAGGSLTGTYPNPTLSSATVNSFDAAGVAVAGDAAHVAAGNPHTQYRLATDVPKIIISATPPADTTAIWGQPQ